MRFEGRLSQCDLLSRPANLDHRWKKPGLTSREAAALQAQNIASLNRKVTFCLNRPAQRLQYQAVEGWSAREVLEHMRERGISQRRIERDLLRIGQP